MIGIIADMRYYTILVHKKKHFSLSPCPHILNREVRNMRETEFIVTEQFQCEAEPDWEAVRLAVTAWLVKELFS